ncbi:hypothetical protein DRQ25_14460 [Candidatus Fermentibacteria bacterium]|nr:MAG: hypothetical protein DRQ25_14460 [Candidatus Fermentibacteria bacterium]
MNHRSLLVCMLGLTVGVLMSDAFAQTRPTTDTALGALIEKLTDRRSDDLIPEELPDGSKIVDLKGRFQQAPLGQFIGDGQAMVACVNSVAEANTFFGRDLLSGKPLSNAASDAHAALVTEALRHGMSVKENQFYGDLIEQGLAEAPLSSTVTIINNDSQNEGFNSTDLQFLPAHGNDTNANLGAQRLALFNAAAQIWGAFLDSSVVIEISSQFDPLFPCTPNGGVLGAAGAVTGHWNFTHAGFADTVYHAALANKQAGSDLSANPDMSATFNSSVDSGCLGNGTHFYYGLDNATPAGTINLFVVLLHEIGHGLGSSSFTNGETGIFEFGIPDIWARYLFDSTAGLSWFEMSNEQRVVSAKNTNNLFWDGANVRNASGFLSAGRDATTGRVQMYTPNPFEGGSSVSHYSNAVSPNLLMEPRITTGLPLDLDLTRQQMRDIGWYRDTSSDLEPDTITSVLPSGGSLQVDSSQNITWTNTGGFARNVTIELSLDGGSTFPIVVAPDVANSGSHPWTVPDSPTNQGRLRVREHDFLSPMGQSAADFVIGGGNAAPTFTPAGAIAREQGSASGAAVTVGTVSDAETAAGSLLVTQVAGGTATGISVGSINNTDGTVTATLAASCSATAGTVRFRVSDGSLNGSGDLQLNIDANSAPTISYDNQSLDGGGATSINPAAGPVDNGSLISVAVQDTDTYTGTISVNGAGVISISSAQPIGEHTITIRATDNCGAITDATFDLQVDNTAPTFTPAGAIVREQGSISGAAVTVGTVSDAQTAAGSLAVTQIAGGTASGISVGSINNTAGTVTATLAASCSATEGTVRFQVSDGSLNGTGDLQLNVTLNTPPTLGSYANTTVAVGQGAMISPDAAPADNGSVDSIEATILPVTFAGTLNADLGTGKISIGTASPSDSYTVSVTITDNCDATAEQDFALEVDDDRVFSDGFETP